MAFTYRRGGFPFQRFAQTLLFVLRGMSLADRALQAGQTWSVSPPLLLTASQTLHASQAFQGGTREGSRAQGWEVKHPPTLLPSHTEAQISAAGVPSPYLSPAWPCISLYLQFYRRNTKSLLEKHSSSGCSETGNKNACD